MDGLAVRRPPPERSAVGAALLNERAYVTQTEGARTLGGGHLLKEKKR